MRPGRDERPDLMGWFTPFEMVASSESLKPLILSFPNIAHDYWDHYRLTGEYYVHSARAPRL
jgi:hypothetical protein